MLDFLVIQQPKTDRLPIKTEDKGEEDNDVDDDGDDDYTPHKATRRSSRPVKKPNYKEMGDDSEEPPQTSKARVRTWKPVVEIDDDDAMTGLKPRRRGKPRAPRTAEQVELEENIIELLKPSTRK